MKNKKEALKRQKTIEKILKLQEDIEYDPWINQPWTQTEEKCLEEADKHHQEWLKNQNIVPIDKEIEK